MLDLQQRFQRNEVDEKLKPKIKDTNDYFVVKQIVQKQELKEKALREKQRLELLAKNSDSKVDPSPALTESVSKTEEKTFSKFDGPNSIARLNL